MEFRVMDQPLCCHSAASCLLLEDSCYMEKSDNSHRTCEKGRDQRYRNKKLRHFCARINPDVKLKSHETIRRGGWHQRSRGI